MTYYKIDSNKLTLLFMIQNKEKILNDIIKVFGSLDSFLDIKTRDYSRPTLNLSHLKSTIKKKILNNQYNFKNMDLLNIYNYKNNLSKATIVNTQEILNELKKEYFI